MNLGQPAPEGKPLRLGKFAPSVEAPPGQAPQTGEGETMFIKRAAAETVEKNLQPAEQQSDEFGLPVKEMLGVITYCYARGVFWSAEIAERLKKEPELRKAFGQNLPDGQAIRRFRRRYAGEIEDALEALYRAFPPKDPELAPKEDGSQTEIVHRQAADRLHDASRTDNIHGRPS
jgi:hypothetical protein